MITDPKTTVRSKWGQCLVAFLVAVAEAILRLDRVVHAPYYALFLVGPAANIVEIWWSSRRQAASPGPALNQPAAPEVAVVRAPAWGPQEESIKPPLTLTPKSGFL